MLGVDEGRRLAARTDGPGILVKRLGGVARARLRVDPTDVADTTPGSRFQLVHPHARGEDFGDVIVTVVPLVHLWVSPLCAGPKAGKPCRCRVPTRQNAPVIGASLANLPTSEERPPASHVACARMASSAPRMRAHRHEPPPAAYGPRCPTDPATSRPSRTRLQRGRGLDATVTTALSCV